MKTKLIPLTLALGLALGLAVTSVQTYAWEGNIPLGDTRAYVQDRDGDIVRDSWGKCVRTIHWSKDTAIAKCEGWEEAKPEVVAKPALVVKPVPAPVVQPEPVAEPEVVIPTLAFTGFFETNGSSLTSEAKAKLDEYVEFLNQFSDKNLNIQGHTDDVGSASFNQKLSERRANTVKSYLESRGIASNRLTATGAGELLSAASNATPEGRAHNRRVVLQVID